MIKQAFTNSNLKYNSLSDEELKSQFKNIDINNKKFSLPHFISIIKEGIKRKLNYTLTKEDIKNFKKFLSGISLNINNNEEIKYAFVLYSIFTYKKMLKPHIIFFNRYLLSNYYKSLKPLYDFFDIKAEINLNPNDMLDDNFVLKSKKDIYKSNIIFTNLEELLYDYIANINIEKIADRIDFKFETAFIFDIDNILFDRDEYIFKIKGHNLKKNEIKLKDFFKLYKNILGVSPELLFEKPSLGKKYNLKIENTVNKNEILNNLKNIKNLYYTNKNEKIKNIAQQIKTLLSENKTIIVDANDDKDLKNLINSLNSNKIKYDIVKDFKISNKKIISKMLTEKKVTILTNMMSIYVKPEIGGDYEYIAKNITEAYKIGKNTNFYKEKLKSELKKQKEIAAKNAENIIKNNSLFLIFTSKYSELKNEYLTINNYRNYLPKENIITYNCPEDELFKKFNIDKLSIVHTPMDKNNENLFKIISLYTFYLRRFLLKKVVLEKNKFIEYTIKSE